MKNLVYKQFEAIAAQYPTVEATRFGTQRMTYYELNRLANQIANLLQISAEKASIIKVIAPAGINLIASLLGVFKAGHIYLPIDIQFAEKRIQQIFAETPEAIVILHGGWQAQWEELAARLDLRPGKLLILDEQHGITLVSQEGEAVRYSADMLSAENPAAAQDPADASYLFYTSGSTGTPKAIMGVHASLAQFIAWEAQEFGITSGFRVSQLIQVTFDASLRDIFLPLCTGGTLCIPDQETRGSIAKLLEWLDSEQIQLLHSVPSLFQQLTKAAHKHSDKPQLAALQYVLLAGEPLYAKDIHKWREAFGEKTEVVNLYGTTETTMIKTFHRIKEVPQVPGQILSVGKPIDQAFILILNQGKLCRIGEIGEVYIKTPFMTKGYYGNPALTQQVFVQNPLVSDKTDIIYKTGDMGRYAPDRSLEILGRQDRQVKINGVRIELGEIEQAVLAVKEVEEVVAKALKDAEGKLQLVCYYTAPAPIDTLREQLAATLNGYLLPSFLVHMLEFPLNSNGKIDSAALPAPEEALLGQDADPPKEGLETTLATIWKEELGLKKISRDHSFYYVGGNSLKAMKIVGDIQQRLNIELKLMDIFVYPTIAKLAAFIEEKAPSAPEQLLLPAPKMASYPLTHTQKRVWLVSNLEEASLAYHMPVAYTLRGQVDGQALEAAFQLLLSRHEVLRTVFRELDGEVRQVILPTEQAGLFRLEQLRPAPHTREALEQEIRSFQNQPFDLANEPLIRAKLFVVSPQEAVLVAVVHHIIFDGWSTSILLHELIASYTALTQGQQPDLAPLALQYKDYAVWQQDRLKSPQLRASAAFWEDQFRDAVPVLELPLDKPRPLIKTFHGQHQEFLLAKGPLEALKAFCSQEQGTLFTGLTAAVNTLLYRYSGQTDIVVGTPVANREQAQTQPLIGFFANTLALRNSFEPQHSFQQLFRLVQHNTQQALQHAEYPFDRLVEALSGQRELSRSPLFDVALILHKAQAQDLDEAAGTPAAVEAQEALELHEHSKFDLTFSFREVAEGLVLKLEYNTDLFYASRISRMGEHLAELIAQVVAAPDTRIHAIDFISAAEKQLLRHLSNEDNVHPLPSGADGIARLFRQQAARYPTKTAVYALANDTCLSYQELDEQSDRVAAYLAQQAGFREGAHIGIMTRRDQLPLVAMLGILKAGAVYVYLEPTLPALRLSYICEHAHLAFVLKAEALAAPAIGAIPVLTLEEALRPHGYPLPGATQNELAYICYTSGSTGTPKGVLIKQASIINMVDATPGVAIRPDDCLLNVCSFAFDGSVFDIYGALLKGGSLVIMDETQAKDVEAYEKAFATHPISVAFMPTALFNVLTDVDFAGFRQLRHLLIGGEAASVKHTERFAARFGAGVLFNLYGPTENTVYSTYYPIGARLSQGTVPIGKPLTNVIAYLRDSFGLPVPLGVVGELCLAGAGLAQEYYNNEVLNAERFGVDSGEAHHRIYRTGDLCKWSEEGELLFTGRKDNMLKIRGFLVETEEIITALQQHPAVKEAMVLYREVAGVPALVAYLALHQEVEDRLVTEFLSQHLPVYMLPTHFVRLAQLPLNTNDKVDRDALNRLPITSAAPTSAAVAVTAEEKALEACWKILLKKEQISLDSNFYALGGDSIKIIQLVAMLRQQGYRLHIKDFMQLPTIAGAAAKLSAVQPAEARVESVGKTGLSAIQQRYVELVDHRYLHHFNQSVKLTNPAGFKPEIVTAIMEKLLAYHDGLRAQFHQTAAGQWQQVIPAGNPRFELPVVDLRTEADPEEALALYATALQESMNLERGELVKAAIFRGQDEDTLLLAIHHLVVDGVSWRILFDDFGTLYSQYEEGQTLTLPAPTDSVLHYVKWQHEYAQSEQLRGEVAYWQAVDATAMAALPVTYPEGRNRVQDSAALSFKLEAAETHVLQTTAAKVLHLEMNDILLAALGMACTRQFGLANVPIHLEGHGREELSTTTDLSRLVGWFTSVFPVVLPAPGRQNAVAYAQAISTSLRQIPNKGVGYGILKYTGAEPLLPRAQSPAICFNYLGQFDSHIATQEQEGIRLALGEKGAEVHALIQRFHELEFSGLLSEGELHLTVQYSRERFGEPEMQQLVVEFTRALADIVTGISEYGQEALIPLSYNQQNFFSPYKLVGTFSEVGPVTFPSLHEAAFVGALQALQQRHEVLRTDFVTHKDQPYMRVQAAPALAIEWLDGQHTPADQREELLQQVLVQARQAVTLRTPWVVRVVRFEEEDELIMVFSHLIFDGYSQNILQAELTTLYQAALQGTPPALPAVAQQYSDFVALQRRYVNDKEGRQSLAYWKNHLRGAELSAVQPADYSIRIPVFVQGEVFQEFESWLEKQKVSPLAALLTVVRRVWLQALGQDDVVVAVPVSMRTPQLYGTLDNQQALGFYSNILLTRGRLDGYAPAVEQLSQVQEGLTEALEHYQYPYDKLLHELQVAPGLYPTLGINYHNYDYLRSTQIDAYTSEAAQEVAVATQTKSWIDVFHFQNALQINVQFNPHDFSLAEAQNLASCFTEEFNHLLHLELAAQLS